MAQLQAIEPSAHKQRANLMARILLHESRDGTFTVGDVSALLERGNAGPLRNRIHLAGLQHLDNGAFRIARETTALHPSRGRYQPGSTFRFIKACDLLVDAAVSHEVLVPGVSLGRLMDQMDRLIAKSSELAGESKWARFEEAPAPTEAFVSHARDTFLLLDCSLVDSDLVRKTARFVLDVGRFRWCACALKWRDSHPHHTRAVERMDVEYTRVLEERAQHVRQLELERIAEEPFKRPCEEESILARCKRTRY